MVDVNAVAVEVWPKTYPININGDDIRATRTEQQPVITESTASYSYSESGKLSALFPGNPSDTTINYLTGTLERKSHPIYRFAVSEIRTERVAKGVLSDTVFPEVQDKADRRLVRRWKVSNLGDGGDGILTHEYEQLWLPRSVVLEDDQESDTLTISYEEGRRYQEYSPGQWVSVPYRLIADIDNLSTDLISDPDFTGQTEFVDGVPAPPTHPETDPEEIEVNTAEANAESNGDSSGASLRARLTYGNRRSLARTTADVSLALSQWNRIVYNLARPEQAADTWQPFLREDAAKSALVRVGHVLQAGEGIVLFGYTGLKAATLAKPITIEDTDAGQLPSETAIAPVYTAIERSVVNDDFPAMSEEISIIELASASVNDDFPVMTEQIIVSEIETAEISDDFPAMSEEISIGEAASASVSDDFPAMTEEVSIVEVVFTPADISPVFWFDADDASTITESGGVISQVNDKSGNANHASQSSSGSRPTVVASAQNGMAGISFDGSNDFLEFDNPAGVRANNAKTIYALWVGQSGVGLYDFTIATRYLSSTDLSRGYIARAESSVGLAYDHTGNGQARAGTYTDGSTAFARWTTGANGATPGFELNGTVLTLAANTLGTALTETSPDRTTIGQQGGGYGGFYLLELVGVTGNPGTAVHDQMAGYFAHRWGLTANLPSGHPYKTTPP